MGSVTHVPCVTEEAAEAAVFQLVGAGIQSSCFVSLPFNSFIVFFPVFQWTLLGFTGMTSVHVSGNFKAQPESMKVPTEIAFLIAPYIKYSNIVF